MGKLNEGMGQGTGLFLGGCCLGPVLLTFLFLLALGGFLAWVLGVGSPPAVGP